MNRALYGIMFLILTGDAGEGLTEDLELASVDEGDRGCKGFGEREKTVDESNEGGGLRMRGFKLDRTTPRLAQACSQASCASCSE